MHRPHSCLYLVPCFGPSPFSIPPSSLLKHRAVTMLQPYLLLSANAAQSKDPKKALSNAWQASQISPSYGILCLVLHT